VSGSWSESIIYFEDEGDVSYDHWSVVVLPRSGEPRALATCDEGPGLSPCTGKAFGQPAVSPDGTRVAMATGGGLALAGIEGGELAAFGQPADHDAPAFSPDGKRLVFAWRGGLWISDIGGRRPPRLVAKGTSPAWSVRNWIAFVLDDAVYRVRPDGSRLRRLAPMAWEPTWSPDGSHIAFVRLRRVPPHMFSATRLGTMRANGSDVRLLSGWRTPEDISDIAWSPNGRCLLVADGRLQIVSLDGRLLSRLATLPDSQVFSVDWAPRPT
jgi:Tol biopolymer transport system component